MKIKDRIKDLRRVKGSEFIPHPQNWRTHPQHQQDALRGVLSKIGIADAVLAIETDDGLMLVDGHARTELDPDTEWPCLVLDLDQQEANELLATFDTITGLATVDTSRLEVLLDDVSFDNEALETMLTNLKVSVGLEISEWNDKVTTGDDLEAYNADREVAAFRIRVPRADEERSVEAIEKALKNEQVQFELSHL